MKNEIQDWIVWKEGEFVVKENINPCLTSKVQFQRYLFTNYYAILFGSFPYEFHEWVSRLTERKDLFKNDEPTTWNPKLIERLKTSNNKI